MPLGLVLSLATDATVTAPPPVPLVATWQTEVPWPVSVAVVAPLLAF